MSYIYEAAVGNIDAVLQKISKNKYLSLKYIKVVDVDCDVFCSCSVRNLPKLFILAPEWLVSSVPVAIKC